MKRGGGGGDVVAILLIRRPDPMHMDIKLSG